MSEINDNQGSRTALETSGAATGASRLRSFARRAEYWKERLLLDPRFQRWASRFPLTRRTARRHATAAFDLCAGFVYSQALYAVIRLGILDLVRLRPLPDSELVACVAVPERQAQLVVNAAIALNLLSRRSDGNVGLGLIGASILANPSIAAMVRHHADLYADLADPIALLDGTAPRGRVAEFWPYAGGGCDRTAGSEDVARYSALMASSQEMLADDILDAYPFGRHRRIVDIGGGEGVFLAALARRHAGPQLHLLDLPPVAERASHRLRQEGLDGRINVIGGSFLDAQLPSGVDLVTLVRIVHDHDDEVVSTLLRAIRRALAPGGTLLIAEPMSGIPEARRVSDVYFAFYLQAMGSGRPRSPAELETLTRAAGFRHFRRYRTARPMLASVVAAT